MTYILNPTSVVYTRYKAKYKFGGSSRYGVLDDEIIDKPRSKVTPKALKLKKELNNKTSDELPLVFEKNEEIEKRKHKLNKSKVKKKCYALSRLSKSKAFLAFYSISFPVNLSDQVCYKLFNIWLTRCRRTGGLNTYLWVAERQKNGTIHFHLLTNDFMPIKIVNGFMAKALKTEKKTGNDVLKEVNTEAYNGVDVKKVGNNKKSLIGYLIKYVAKNNIEFYRLPWHCSRDVSVLNTSTNFNEPDDKKYFDKLPMIEDISKIEDLYRVKKTEKYNVAGFNFIPNDELYNEVDSYNEAFYNEYQEQKLRTKEKSKNEER
jgi:hypothetical protein